MLKLKLPLVAGVPEIAPPEPNDRPGGRVPVKIANVCGGVPPLAVRVVLYAMFCVAFGIAAGVIEIAGHCAYAAPAIASAHNDHRRSRTFERIYGR